ncbi:hypothetical protein O181_067332 [Austropuccinia psidii MF-1]|uniref:Uncharacterized protein n=1 Tax=Austropuccinia psidii MF-1 TaxID=1389203 RepID=A0A9Q3EX58_9BASI|nr:hypothetical protein [Austropuccinia psidii MF-1]
MSWSRKRRYKREERCACKFQNTGPQIDEWTHLYQSTLFQKLSAQQIVPGKPVHICSVSPTLAVISGWYGAVDKGAGLGLATPLVCGKSAHPQWKQEALNLSTR